MKLVTTILYSTIVHLQKDHGHVCTTNPADCFVHCPKCKAHRFRSKSESDISRNPVKFPVCPTRSLPIGSSPATHRKEESHEINETGTSSPPVNPPLSSPPPESLPDPDEVIHVLAPSLFDKEYPYKLFLGNFWILEPIIVLFLAFQTLSSIFITLCENGGAYTVFHDGLNISEFINRIILLLLRILVRVASPFIFYRQICSMAEAEKALQIKIKKEDHTLPPPKPVPNHKHVTLWSIVSHAVLFSVILLYLDAFLTAEDRLNDNSICIKRLFQVQVPLLGMRLFVFCDYLSCFFILMLVGLVKDCYCIENRLSTAHNEYFDIIRQRWYRIDFFCYTIPLLLTLFSIVSLTYNQSITPMPAYKLDANGFEIWCFWLIVLSLLLFFGSSTNRTARVVTVVGNILALCCAFFISVVLGVEKANFPPGSIDIMIYCHLSMTTINLLFCLTKAHGRHKGHRSWRFWFSLVCLILLTISMFAIVIREVISLAISVVWT